MILIIDNFDSFTYNLVQYIGEVQSQEVQVFRNNSITIEQIKRINPSHIILSPGPCTPNQAGICIELVKELHSLFPILGVCLGHQAIAQAFGAKITKAKRQLHGKISIIKHDCKDIFESCPNPMKVGRYHSLIAVDLPEMLKVRALDEIGEVMAISHSLYPNVIGVQFHPESILTKSGHDILRSFLTRQFKDFYQNDEKSNNTVIWRA